MIIYRIAPSTTATSKDVTIPGMFQKSFTARISPKHFNKHTFSPEKVAVDQISRTIGTLMLRLSDVDLSEISWIIEYGS